ncbi:MAG: 2Fe-2S iron-sulfur cluster-binding protein [Ostreibacterium sp.]
MNNNRLPLPFGTLLDRATPVNFSFDGNAYSGFAGDTIASALIANNQKLISRSFKYHRPRGILSMAGQDANTLVALPSKPNTLADRERLMNGMSVSAQNVSGRLSRDYMSLLGLFSRFLPVGFYYKAFFKPKGMWERWAPFIRKNAGLGVIDPSYIPGYFDKQYGYYDVAVIGAGPSGMASALQAASTGAEVLLVDENAQLGGSLNYARIDIEGVEATQLLEKMRAEIAANDNITVMTDAICNGWFSDNWLPIIQGQRLFKVRAKQVLMCVGVMEQQAVFRNNDLPGVMMGSAAQRLIRLYGVRPGQRAVVLAGNNEGYAVALDLLDAEVDVAAIIELREQPIYDDVANAVLQRGVKVHRKTAVYQAIKKSNCLAAVEVRKILSQGKCDASGETISCDLLCMSVGFTPTYQLVCQAGGQLNYDDDSAIFSLNNLPENFYIAGSVNGYWQSDAVIADGQRAAMMATNGNGQSEVEVPKVVVESEGDSLNFGWPMFAHPKGKEFVDFDEDLQMADIINATRDGYEHVQLVKRYSTCGMGPSQGRHSALATARLVADATDKTVAQTGVTTARPPFAPETLAHCAGRSFYPERRTNMHDRHIEAGAQMMQAGAWYRPAYYGEKNAAQQWIAEEVNHVRNNVGLIDVSTLGGLEIRGSDAAEFLNRIYTFAFIKLPVGKTRYALMTNEAGVVIDDGVACRLSDNHFYVTATTGGVERVYQSMLKWNAQWQLDVDISNVTSAWCGVNIAGPKAREVLQTICHDLDLSNEQFPYLGVREGLVADISARFLRVGFVGELGYEIHVPQHNGEALWDALMLAGKEHGIKPFGVEAQRILRLEKGHIIIGQDTDAMSNPMEVQMNWAIARKKPFYVGGRTIRELEKAPIKRCLVGFVVNDPQAPIPLESHLVLQGEKMVGRVTSCQFSPTLGKPVGLAYVPVEQAEPGNEIMIKSTGGVPVPSMVVALPFYDPDTARQEV